MEEENLVQLLIGYKDSNALAKTLIENGNYDINLIHSLLKDYIVSELKKAFEFILEYLKDKEGNIFTKTVGLFTIGIRFSGHFSDIIHGYVIKMEIQNFQFKTNFIGRYDNYYIARVDTSVIEFDDEIINTCFENLSDKYFINYLFNK